MTNIELGEVFQPGESNLTFDTKKQKSPSLLEYDLLFELSGMSVSLSNDSVAL